MPHTCTVPRARPARARSRLHPAAHSASVLLVVVACATGSGGPDPEKPVFADVGKVALLRWNDRSADKRAKDPLDGLAESLGARGIVTRALEVGPRGPDSNAALERLWAEVEGRIRSAPPHELRGSAQPLWSGAGKVVRELGVDAVALYLRLDRYRMLPPATGATPPDFPPPSAIGAPGAQAHPLPESRYRPVAALAVVGKEGGLVWSDWGPRDEAVDVPGPVNAAEALDEVVRLLTGDPPPEER